jgi:energy-coupling factor transporter transmembrane protein EcfT
MHVHDTVESIVEKNAWLHRSAVDKALLCGGLLLLSLVLKAWPWGIVVLACTTTAACLLADIPIRSWLFALRPLIAFACLGALPLLWIGSGRAMDVTLRALAAGSSVVLFIVTTPIGEALSVFMRFRVIEPLVEMAFLSLRFAAILRESAQSVAIAVHCRGGHRRRLQVRFAIQGVASVIARAFERARRAEVGMSLRCGAEEVRFWTARRASSTTFRAVSASVCLLVTASAYLLGGQSAWR